MLSHQGGRQPQRKSPAGAGLSRCDCRLSDHTSAAMILSVSASKAKRGRSSGVHPSCDTQQSLIAVSHTKGALHTEKPTGPFTISHRYWCLVAICVDLTQAGAQGRSERECERHSCFCWARAARMLGERTD